MDKKNECFYCGSAGELKFWRTAGYGPTAYLYDCPVCGYQWEYDVVSGKNCRRFPINHKVIGRAA